MRNVITIGEMVLDTLYRDDQPVEAFVGGRIPNAAMSLARMGHPTWVVSECCTDHVGDFLVSQLEKAGVHTECIDRFTDGATALSAIFEQADGKVHRINYFDYRETDTRFNVVWPRINPDDIVLIGSLYCVDTPQRQRVLALIKHAQEMGAVIINLPGFQHGVRVMMAKLMPALIENMEMSSLVIAKDQDAALLFPDDPANRMFADHVQFYCPSMLQVSDDFSQIQAFAAGESSTIAVASQNPNSLAWQAGFAAGVVHEIIHRGISQKHMEAITVEELRHIASGAIDVARKCAAAPDHLFPTEYK